MVQATAAVAVRALYDSLVREHGYGETYKTVAAMCGGAETSITSVAAGADDLVPNSLKRSISARCLAKRVRHWLLDGALDLAPLSGAQGAPGWCETWVGADYLGCKFCGDSQVQLLGIVGVTVDS